MKPTCLLLALKFLAVFTTIESAGRRLGGTIGGWTPIKNISDPHVTEIGEFAVDEYMLQTKSDLKFERVVSGESQVVGGTNYKLVIEVDEKKVKKEYEVVVLEKAWMRYMHLVSFKALN